MYVNIVKKDKTHNQEDMNENVLRIRIVKNTNYQRNTVIVQKNSSFLLKGKSMNQLNIPNTQKLIH